MRSLDLNSYIKKTYDERVLSIQNNNIDSEREYYSSDLTRYPERKVMHGVSFEDHIQSFKYMVRGGNRSDVMRVFMALESYLLFSYKRDAVFKEKLRANGFVSTPFTNFIYPMLHKEITDSFDDSSISLENKKADDNINMIDSICDKYMDVQTMLYLLYCNNFQFPEGWQVLFRNTKDDVIRILNESNITIGEFLDMLVDYKCDIIESVLREIGDEQLRDEYLEKSKKLREIKHDEVRLTDNIDLPVTYSLKDSTLESDNNHAKKF